MRLRRRKSLFRSRVRAERGERHVGLSKGVSSSGAAHVMLSSCRNPLSVRTAHVSLMVPTVLLGKEVRCANCQKTLIARVTETDPAPLSISTCPVCKAKIDPGTTACPDCGYLLNTPEPQLEADTPTNLFRIPRAAWPTRPVNGSVVAATLRSRPESARRSPGAIGSIASSRPADSGSCISVPSFLPNSELQSKK